MTGNFSAISKTAARTATATAAVALLFAHAGAAQAQVITVPDTTRADSVVTAGPTAQADTAKEVTHVVKRGDTLWDLANYYLKDPFRWPEIFRRNTDVVENPHWIYPGELIRIWGDEVKPDALARADSAGNVVSHIVTRPTQPTQLTTGPELTVFASPLSRAAAEIGAQAVNRSRNSGVRRGEVESAPYVERRGGPRGAGRLVASVDRLGIQSTSTESRFQLNDRVYVELPRGTVARPDDRYLTYVMGEEIAGVGQVLIPTGIVRIEDVQVGSPTKARVVRQFAEVRSEQGLIPFSEAVLPPAGASPIAGGSGGKVLYIHNAPVLPSIGHYVVLSPNARNGAQVGDEYSFIDAAIGRRDETAAPPVSAGVAQVVKVTPFATTAIIISQTQPTIREGMQVQLTGKMR